MKYLILFFIAINAYANVEVVINSPKNGGIFKFETQVEADAWKSENIENNSWGKPDRWERKEDTCPGAERTVGIAPDDYQECFYPVEYTITETDISSQVAQENALSQIKKDMEFGKNLYAKVRLMNQGKGLTKVQRKQLRNTLSSIRDDLFDGDICSAKEDIAAITPDAVISAADKANVIALIDGYKTCP